MSLEIEWQEKQYPIYCCIVTSTFHSRGDYGYNDYPGEAENIYAQTLEELVSKVALYKGLNESTDVGPYEDYRSVEIGSITLVLKESYDGWSQEDEGKKALLESEGWQEALQIKQARKIESQQKAAKKLEEDRLKEKEQRLKFFKTLKEEFDEQ